MARKKQIQSEDEARLLKAKADKAEIEVEQKRNELIDIKVVEREWANMVLSARNKLLAIPTGMAAELSTMTSPTEIEAALKRVIHQALHELSRKSYETKKEEEPPPKSDAN